MQVGIFDEYTGLQIAPNGKNDLDHVIPIQEIHNDRGRILTGVNGIDLANSPENLMPTDRSINRSKTAKSTEEFIQYLERTGEQRQAEISSIQEQLSDSQDLPIEKRDKLQKELHKLEELEAVDIEKLRQIDQQAREAYEQKLAKAYYRDLRNPNCRQLYLDTAKAAGKRGVQDGCETGARLCTDRGLVYYKG